MPRYGIKTLIYIAENYEDFEPDVSRSNTTWGSSRWADLIDMKIDFDRAFSKLSPMEQKLIKDPNTSNPKGRTQVFYRMLGIVNGRKPKQYL